MKPKVLVVFHTATRDYEALLSGIQQFQQENEKWDIYVDYYTHVEKDMAWLDGDEWTGVLSRTTSQCLVDACRRKGVPLVDMNDSALFPGVPKVRSDNAAMGHMAAEELFELGYRNLFYVTQNALWANERGKGFHEALSLLGGTATEFRPPVPAFCNPVGDRATVQALTTWLKTLPRPAGIFAAHDPLGRMVLQAAERAGLLVPDEIAVVGVNDDHLCCEVNTPTMTSVTPDSRQIGYVAASKLARLMRGERCARAEVLVEPSGVARRQSTNKLIVKDRGISKALEIIREEACQGITVKDVTRRAGITRVRLERGLRTLLGRSPHAEIRRLQFAKIKELLRDTDLPLKQIAMMTGFEHVEYLNVSFKRVIGQTPGKYRSSMRAKSGRGHEMHSASDQRSTAA